MDFENIVSVSILNAYIRKLFVQDEYLRQVFVQGEIANLRNYRGHLYFTLKDEKSSIKGVMWQSDAKRLSFVPEEGMQVIVAGGVSVFERDGAYQVYASFMEPSGLGALYAALERLKIKLEQEGLFSLERKRPLPFFPRAVGLVTSIRSAAIKDIVTVGKRRYPGVQFIVADSKVQGQDAGYDIAAGIESLNLIPYVDVIIVGRGGGSQEDLFVFNHEVVARAIFASRVPVVSAVGHERDVTIADLVADVRAATPSAAAELVVPNAQELYVSIENLLKRAHTSVLRQIDGGRKKLLNLSSRPCLERPDWFLIAGKESLVHVSEDLEKAMVSVVDRERQKFSSLAVKLNALSPLQILSRGYSVTRAVPGLEIIRDYGGVPIGSEILVNLHKGSLICVVEDGANRQEVLLGNGRASRKDADRTAKR